VSAFNLADSYKVGKINLGPEIMRLRQDAFDKLIDKIDGPKSIFLTRLFYGLPTPMTEDWFVNAFGEDPSFSMVDNTREAAILAGALLNACMIKGDGFSCIVALSASVAGNRMPIVSPQVLQAAADSLATESVADRKHISLEVNRIKAPAPIKINAETVAAVPNFPSFSPVLQQVVDQLTAADTQLSKQVVGVFQDVSKQNQQFREEIDMLWWFVGGWSRLLNEPFASFDAGVAAILAGLDMSDLSKTVGGPVSAPSLLHKTLLAGRKAKLGKVALKDVIDAVQEKYLGQLKLSEKLANVSDLCPVLGALKKVQENGPSPAWHGAFRKATGLEETLQISPLDLAVQVMRERTIIGEI
jgi:hypothetical protein